MSFCVKLCQVAVKLIASTHFSLHLFLFALLSHSGRGNWVCDGGLEGEGRETTKTILMASVDDGE